MPITLPQPIAAFFAGDAARDAEAVSTCFAPDATVIDEGNHYSGRAAIRQWIANASTQYRYTSTPFAMTQEDGRTVVTSRLEGNFPGSPVDLRYRFALAGDQIAALEIVP